jgi:hypothetical protein
MQLVDVLTLAGRERRSSEASLEKFSDIDSVVELVITLNMMVGQQITSVDLDILSVEAGLPFNSRTMEDSEPQGRSRRPTEGFVLCTSSLGLKQAKGSSETILMKPKVLLDSVLSGSTH